MLHVRAIAPAGRTEDVVAALSASPGVTNLAVLPGAARRPEGDLVLCDVAREAANDVLDALQALGLREDGSISVDTVEMSISADADRAEREAPGYGEDAVIWQDLDQATAEQARLSWAFLAFLALATQLGAIAAMIDSPVLIVGAMVLGPEFGAIAAICFGIVLHDPDRIRTAVRTLVVGFAVAIAITYVCALVSRWIGVIDMSALPADRPLTGFVYSPDRWSFIVALLAGTAGVLSMTAGRSTSLVGVFISVTTVPAAGNLAVAVALKQWDEVMGSVEQLAINIAGMLITGTATLLVQRRLWGLVRRRRRLRYGR
jgi:uncharacterized hydrophobic protein (TIGR00271 family)